MRARPAAPHPDRLRRRRRTHRQVLRIGLCTGSSLSRLLVQVAGELLDLLLDTGAMTALSAEANLEGGPTDLKSGGPVRSDQTNDGHPPARQLERVNPALLTILDREGVGPTNNRAERTLRAVVLRRKGSFGAPSEEGSLVVERTLTVVRTLRLHGRSVLDFVEETIPARVPGHATPSLLPEGKMLRRLLGGGGLKGRPRSEGVNAYTGRHTSD
jgi:hypothetical protein